MELKKLKKFKTRLSRHDLTLFRKKTQDLNLRIVFTNGCFDILHKGHIDLLKKAKCLGDILVVGINSDYSINRIKGEKRPINKERDRAYILCELKCVDFITIFDEETPLETILSLKPDILVKGDDWEINNIVGKKEVEFWGGKIVRIPLTKGFGTTIIIKKILSLYQMRDS